MVEDIFNLNSYTQSIVQTLRVLIVEIDQSKLIGEGRIFRAIKWALKRTSDESDFEAFCYV